MVGGRTYVPPPLFDPRRHSRAALLEWCRNRAPDLRLGYATVESERRAFARWTWAGQTYERDAVDEELLAQEVASAIARLLRIPTRIDRGERLDLERQVIAAAASGNVESADALGRQLAIRNEGYGPGQVRTRFER